MRIKEKDVYTYLIKFFNDNIELMPKELVKKACNIDIIKNNFSKNSIYLNYTYFRRLIRTGERSKGFPDVLYNISLNYLNDNKNNNNIKYIEKVTYEYIENQFLKDKDELEDKCLKIVEENRKKIIMLEKMNDEISKYLQYKVELLIAKRNEDIRKLFEKIGE